MVEEEDITEEEDTAVETVVGGLGVVVVIAGEVDGAVEMVEVVEVADGVCNPVLIVSLSRSICFR